jgi:hypothetical protein
MTNKTYTDASYDLIGHLDIKKKRLLIILIISLVLASLGLAMNALGIAVVFHQKGGPVDLNLLMASANIVICSVFLVIGANQYLFLRNYKEKVRQMELLEEKIFQEVLGPR